MAVQRIEIVVSAQWRTLNFKFRVIKYADKKYDDSGFVCLLLRGETSWMIFSIRFSV
jgi:hypothetical protein